MTNGTWTPYQVDALREMYERGVPDRVIAAATGRSVASVYSKRQSLGLAITPDEARRRQMERHAAMRHDAQRHALEAFDRGATVREIARSMCRDHSTVTRWLRAAGRDTSRHFGVGKGGPKVRVADVHDYEPPAADAVKPAPADLSAFYAGRRYDADDMRLLPAPTLRGLPPTHVPTQSVLMGA